MDIAQYLADLLAEHDEVSIPGLGAIYKEKIPAKFNHVTHHFDPPSFRLSFTETEHNSDRLIRHISETKHISFSSAEFFAGRFGEDVRIKLEPGGRADISPVGFLEQTSDGITLISDFEPEDSENFGLKPVAEWAPDEIIPLPPAPETPVAAPIEVTDTEPAINAAPIGEHLQHENTGLAESVIAPSEDAKPKPDTEPEAASATETLLEEAPHADPEPVTPTVITLPAKVGEYPAEPFRQDDISPMFDRIVLREKSSSWINETPEDYDEEPRKRRIWLSALIWAIVVAGIAGGIYLFWNPISASINKLLSPQDSTAIAPLPPPVERTLADSLADSASIFAPDTDTFPATAGTAADTLKAAAIAGKYFIVASFNQPSEAQAFITEIVEKNKIPARIIATNPKILVSVGPAYTDRKSLLTALPAIQDKIKAHLFPYP
jgi:hypothetical protein